MNLHALQTHESRADALELMSVAKNIITPQANRPVMGIVQDSLLSSYMMTQPGIFVDKAEICNMAMWVADFETLPAPAVTHPDRWSGLQCMSMLFPTDFRWKDRIVNGTLLKGPLGKKALGRSHGSIIHVLYNDYGPDRTCRFINELQRINHIWFSSQGFSIGIGDMRIRKDTANTVANACAHVDEDAKSLRKRHGAAAESKINRMLNKTRDAMGLIAQNAMTADNCLNKMVSSGSKGSLVNILQIMACVGQQNCQGKRIQPTLGNRTLPMFKPFDDSPRARGFVKHSYIQGLTPDEYWNHTVGGREGLVDTAVKTSTTGYIQRRLVKSLESVHVANDTSVRDSQNRVIQFLYGEDGLDGMCHEMVECPFDDMQHPPDDTHWPELTQAYHDWKYYLTHRLGEKWAVTVPCERIHTKYQDNGRTSPEQTRSIITPLLNAVQSNKMVYTYVLAIMTKHTCSPPVLQHIVEILMKRWHHSIVAPGEMVGTIAAQSVGEPTTQLTLNTFHQAGNSAKNVTLGVPRFEELINASKKMKTPVLTVHSGTILRPENAWKLKTEIERTTMRDITVRHDFCNDEAVLKAYLELPDNNKWSTTRPAQKILRCIIGRKHLVERGLTIYQVVNVLRARVKHMCFAYGDNATGDITLLARSRKETAFYQHVKTMFDATIKGSPKIPRVSVRTENDEFVIDTEGIDLRHIQSINAIEQNRIQCNDIFAIRNTYGVEAARAALLKEIHTILSFDGSYVNIRHLMTIVDWMTWGGNITALNRHGVKKMMEGATPLKRATFEQPVEILHNAAVKGLHDELNGVSEQLLIGKMPACGSHFNSTVVEKSYQEVWDNDTWEPSDSEDEDVPMGVDTWRPTQNMCQNMWESHTTFAQNEELPYSMPAVSATETSSCQKPAWQQPQQPAWQQPQQPAWQQQQQPAWQQPQQPTWQQPQQPRQPAWQQPQQPQQAAWQQPQQASAYSPTSPAYSPASPAYSPASPAYSPGPAYSPASPAYSPASPAYSPASPAYSPTSPAYSPASPAYSPTSPAYSPASPAYSPTSPAYSPASPAYSPTSPSVFAKESPVDGYHSNLDEAPLKRQKTNINVTSRP